jgi:3-oxoacyl-[acyl-carrier-protein] synthase-3
MRSRISGLGEWLPPTVRSNDDWPASFAEAGSRASGKELVERETIDARDADLCDRIVARRSAAEAHDPFRGTKRRRVADESMSSSEAEAIAARAALADAGIDAKDVDLVMSWALVPDRLSPCNAPKVAALVGARNAAALGTEAACATSITQIMLAAAMIESGRARHVLLTQSHLIARANPMSHPASPLLGDAATAIVMSASEKSGVLATHAVSDGDYYDAVTWVRGRDCDPPWWKAGEAFVPGTRDRERTQRLAREAVRIGVQTVHELMDRARTRASEIDVLASSQVRRWFPESVAEALGLPDGAAPQTFEELAHIGACGVVTNLIQARREHRLQPGARVALYAMGAGMTRAAALLEWQ